MPDSEQQQERCLACDIVWNILMVAGAVCLGFVAYDTLTNGKGTELLGRLAARAKPGLAAVIPIGGDEDDSDAG